jgi:hypothetical protein
LRARWTGDELIEQTAPPADDGTDWVVDGWTVEFERPNEQRSQLTLTRGGASVVLPKVADVLSSGSGDAILVLDSEGFKRVSLPSGEQHVILAASKANPVLQLRGSLETSVWLSSADGIWHLYEPETGTTQPVNVGAVVQTPHTFLADGRVIGKGAGDFWIREVDGTARRLIPRPGE